MTLLAYLLKVIVVSAILYGYYRLFLRNKLFHHYNRFFLLSALLLSIALPFIRIPLLYQPENPVNDAMYRTISVINPVYEADPPAHLLDESVFTLMSSIYLLYAIGVLFLLTLVIKSLLYIRSLRRRYPAEKITSLRFYNTHEPGTPFSFFRSIFWNDQLPFNSNEGQQIFRHELFHVQHRHSVDRLIAELLTALFWFNPFFHLIKKELKAIHEFLADQFAISDSDRYTYATLLVQQAFEPGRHAVTNHFFQNHIKRRIAMITQFKQSKYGYWSRVMVLPVSLLLFCFVSLYARKPAPDAAVTIFQTGDPAKTKDTIPAGAAKEKEMQKLQAKQLQELKRKLQEQEEVMQKARRAELETLKKQLMEQELTARKLEENRGQQQEEVLKLKTEMEARRQNLEEASREQHERLLKMLREEELKAKDDRANKPDYEKRRDEMMMKIKEMQEQLQMKQSVQEEMIKEKMLELEMKSKEHTGMSKTRQAELLKMKQQLQNRQNSMKKKQLEELQHLKEELLQREKEMNDKEHELRRQKEQSSYYPAKPQNEERLWTKTRELQKPRLTGNEGRESVERVERRMRSVEKPGNRAEIRKREIVRKAERRETLKREPVKAREPRKATKPVKIKTKPEN